MDLSKEAFDKVPHNELLFMLWKIGALLAHYDTGLENIFLTDCALWLSRGMRLISLFNQKCPKAVFVPGVCQ